MVPQLTPFQQYVAITMICVCAIVTYGNVRCSSKTHFKDPLLTQLGLFDLDGWSLTHVIYYALLGYLFPKHMGSLFFVGVLWEIVEEFVLNRLSSARTSCASILPRDDPEQRWWFGRVSDIPMNTIGLIIGSSFA